MNIEDAKVGQKVRIVRDWSFFPRLHGKTVTVTDVSKFDGQITIVADDDTEDTGDVQDVLLVEDVESGNDNTVKEKLEQIEKLVAEIKAILY